jgi:hypothetical protein
MKRLLCALAVLGAACSGGPSVPSLTYPNLLGGWTGIMNVTLIQNGASGAINQCLATFVVQTQNGGDFTGAFQAAPINGVTVAPCAPLTSFSGKFSNIASGPNPSDVDIVLPAETPTGCTLISQTPLSGPVSPSPLNPGGMDLSLIQTNRFQCGTASPVQFIQFGLQRR